MRNGANVRVAPHITNFIRVGSNTFADGGEDPLDSDRLRVRSTINDDIKGRIPYGSGKAIEGHHRKPDSEANPGAISG